MWKQGTEPIPSGELPFSFNIIVSNRRGSIGLSSVSILRIKLSNMRSLSHLSFLSLHAILFLILMQVYQVVCWDRPNFDSLYCSMCSVWITAFEMLLHLMSDTHRLNYFVSDFISINFYSFVLYFIFIVSAMHFYHYLFNFIYLLN